MKKIILIIVPLIFAGIVSAQNEKINYKVLQDDPRNFYPKLNLNIIVGGIDMGTKNIDGLNIYYGAQGCYMLNDKLGFQAAVNLPWLTLGKLRFADFPSAKSFEGGALFLLSHKGTIKNLRVILKSERGTKDGKNVETTTFIMVPGNQEVLYGLRGGLYIKNGAYTIKDKDPQLDAYDMKFTSLTSMGIYAGVVKRSLTNLIVQAGGYGKCMNSIGADLYFDLMFIPYNSFTLLNDPNATSPVKKGDDATDEVNKYIKNTPLGFRLGWTGYQIAPKEATGKRFGMSFNFEGGLLPYQGWFVKGGIGITIMKKVMGGSVTEKK